MHSLSLFLIPCNELQSGLFCITNLLAPPFFITFVFFTGQMFRSIKHNKDFEALLSYERVNELPPGVSSNKFAHYSVSGLTESSEK